MPNVAKKTPPLVVKSHHKHRYNGGHTQEHEEEVTISFSEETDGSLTDVQGGSSHSHHRMQPMVHLRQQERLDRSTSSTSINSLASSIPPPPPPPPVIPQPQSHQPIGGVQSQRRQNQEVDNSSVRSSTMSVHEELKSVLEIFREKEKGLHIPLTPEVYISKNSCSKEVQNWLMNKKFSSRVLKQLKGIDGNKLLLMKKSDLVAAFGKEEGGRLDGQLTICKKTTGFGTASSELRDILKKARQRTGESPTDT